MTEQKRKFPIVKIFLIAVVLIGVLAIVALKQYLSGQHVRQFASESARVLNDRICPSGYARGNPCGTKDVRQEADSGLIAYLYVYGVINLEEIDELSKVVKTLRSSKPFYRKTPVKVIFYADLHRSSVVKQFWILGE